jgi:hypothetical protein
MTGIFLEGIGKRGNFSEKPEEILEGKKKDNFVINSFH